jgi:hypothetical protein
VPCGKTGGTAVADPGNSDPTARGRCDPLCDGVARTLSFSGSAVDLDAAEAADTVAGMLVLLVTVLEGISCSTGDRAGNAAIRSPHRRPSW